MSSYWHRFFSYCACFNVRRLLRGPQDAVIASPFSPNLIRTKNEGHLCRSRAIPDSIHIKNGSHLGMDGTRDDEIAGATRAGHAMPGLESSSGVSRDEKQCHPVKG
ncbi:hypothetical protein DPEC_G00323600 [Dallia pectoralis]|uniref:Uncharacterized protein n=1 Tax=Dallia pectoralis TaxID=75939 RepID=A0ACC2FAV6_DALPE|nr:hypothetical protein DPEC_G00323600 [Dallia pectoralis]